MGMQEERDASLPQLASENSGNLQSAPILRSLIDVKQECVIKEEPVDSTEEDPKYLADVTRYGNRPNLAMGTPPQAVDDATFNLSMKTLIQLMKEETSKAEINAEFGNLSTTAQDSSNRRKTIHNYAPSGDEEVTIFVAADHDYVSTMSEPRPKAGRPLKVRDNEETNKIWDHFSRHRAKNRDAAFRYREKKKAETWNLKMTEQEEERRNKELKMIVDDLTVDIEYWRGACIKALDSFPKIKFVYKSPVSSASLSQSTANSAESIDSLSSPHVPDTQNLLALLSPLKILPEKKMQYDDEQRRRLRQEEKDLTALNASLRNEALCLYNEIINAHMLMVRAGASSTHDLPILCIPTQVSPLEIADLLRSTKR